MSYCALWSCSSEYLIGLVSVVFRIRFFSGEGIGIDSMDVRDWDELDVTDMEPDPWLLDFAAWSIWVL